MFSLRGVTQDGDPPTMLQTRAKQPTTTKKNASNNHITIDYLRDAINFTPHHCFTQPYTYSVTKKHSETRSRFWNASRFIVL